MKRLSRAKKIIIRDERNIVVRNEFDDIDCKNKNIRNNIQSIRSDFDDVDNDCNCVRNEIDDRNEHFTNFRNDFCE